MFKVNNKDTTTTSFIILIQPIFRFYLHQKIKKKNTFLEMHLLKSIKIYLDVVDTQGMLLLIICF